MKKLLLSLLLIFSTARALPPESHGSSVYSGTQDFTGASSVTGIPSTGITGTLPVAHGGTGVTTSTGTGSTVLSASPTFTGTITAGQILASASANTQYLLQNSWSQNNTLALANTSSSGLSVMNLLNNSLQERSAFGWGNTGVSDPFSGVAFIETNNYLLGTFPTFSSSEDQTVAPPTFRFVTTGKINGNFEFYRRMDIAGDGHFRLFDLATTFGGQTAIFDLDQAAKTVTLNGAPMTVQMGTGGRGVNIIGSSNPEVFIGTDSTHGGQFYITGSAAYLGTASNTWPLNISGSLINLTPSGTGTVQVNPNAVAITGTLTVSSTVNGNTITTGTGTLTLGSVTLNAGAGGTLGGLAFVTPGTGIATWAATPSSANLAAALTDETGTGAAVFAGSPALTGTPTAPTATMGTNTTQLATTAFVQAYVPTGVLLAANNLSDLASPTAARGQLGLQDMATQSSTLVGITGGTLTGVTVNGNTLTSGTFTITGSAGKVLTFNNTLTLSGANGAGLTLAGSLITTGAFNTTFAQAATTTVTLPSTSSAMARTDAAQTFTGSQSFSGKVGIGATASGTFFGLIKGTNDNTLLLDNDGSQYTSMYYANNGTQKGQFFLDNTGSRFGVGGAATGIALQLFYGAGSTGLTLNGTTGNCTIAKDLIAAGALTVGGGVKITNIRHGITSALVLGASTVTDAGCTANTRYFFTTHTLGTITVPGSYYASTRTASTSFVITSSQPTDTSTVDWMAIEP